MMRRFVQSLFLLSTVIVNAQDPVSVIKIQEVKRWMELPSDTTYVIHFWATWCKPCLEELPAFEKLHDKYQSEKVRVHLVSIDFLSKLETKLIPFVNEHKLESPVFLLDEPSGFTWIDEVSRDWGGTIPATMIVCNPGNKREFREEELNFTTLDSLVNKCKRHH